MKRISFYLIVSLIIFSSGCERDFGRVEIPDFNYPESITFSQNLSDYNIFEGKQADLIPTSNFHKLELSSTLFTDFAYKQRLISVPDGTQISKSSDGSVNFPNGTILTKTFYYLDDETKQTASKNIIETRLLIKEEETWNIATYVWNDEQTDATLKLDGLDKQVNWIDKNGLSKGTLYHIPDHDECIACHQSNGEMTYIGPKLRNLNRPVDRNGVSVNQISYLQSLGILEHFNADQIPEIPNYKEVNLTLEERGRAYLDLNCAHCHNPGGWEASSERDFDFRFETLIGQTGILSERNRIIDALQEQEMPFIGTTLLDQEGVDLVTSFIESL